MRLEPAALATLVTDEFAYGDGDLAIGPHDRLRGLLSMCGVPSDDYEARRGSKAQKLRHFVEVSDDATRLRIVKAVLDELPPTDHEPERRTKAREKLAQWVQAQETAAPSAPSNEFTLREARSDEGLPVVRLHPDALGSLKLGSEDLAYLEAGATGTYVQVRRAKEGGMAESELLAPSHVLTAIASEAGATATLEPEALAEADDVEVTVAVRGSDDETFYSPVQAEDWIEATRRTLQGLPVASGDVLRVQREHGDTILVNVDRVVPGEPMVVGPDTSLLPSPSGTVEQVPKDGLSPRAKELFSPVLEGGEQGVTSSEGKHHALLDNDLARGEDLLNREREYNALARMAAAWRLEPPLAIGIFGDWGSGKTFFMDRMRRRVESLSRAARKSNSPQRQVAYCKRVAQVRFNAWHYQGSNLWASLVDHIFNNLRYEEGDEDALLEARKEQLLEDLEAAKELKQEAEEEAQAARSQVDMAREQLEEAKEDLRAAFDNKTGWTEAAADVANDELLAGLVGESGGDTAKDLEELYHEARALKGPIAAVSFSARHIPRTREQLGAPVALGVLAIVGAIITIVMGWFPALWTTLAGVAAAVAPLAQRLSTWTHRVRSRLETVHTRVERKARAAVAVHEAELKSRREALTQALMAEQEAEARVERLSEEARKLSPGQLLAEFIEDRADSDDYRQHLGLHAQVRNDFDRLARHFRELREAEEMGEEGVFLGEADGGEDGGREAQSVNRIVLYIDDLDRCSPDRVVEVLEAVHLLLAFPLFVVVVAVDARWVTKALEEEYPHLNGDETRESGAGSATPYDYLEKIFQVPLWLRPLRPEDAEKIVAGCIDRDGVPDGDAGSLQSDLGPDGAESTSDSPADENEKLHRQELDAGPQSTERAAEQQERRAQDASEESEGQRVHDHKPLQLSESEWTLLKTIAPAVGKSPRTLKRFVNSYRVLKATKPPRESSWVTESGGPARPAETMFLLAIVMSQGSLLESFQSTLREGNHTSIDELLDSVEERVGPEAQARWLHLRQSVNTEIRGPAEPELIARFRREFSRVERYAFEAPRMVQPL